jgi:hypothetical protein
MSRFAFLLVVNSYGSENTKSIFMSYNKDDNMTTTTTVFRVSHNNLNHFTRLRSEPIHHINNNERYSKRQGTGEQSANRGNTRLKVVC